MKFVLNNFTWCTFSCLSNFCQVKVSIKNLWTLFSQSQPLFAHHYTAYHHFRANGWVVRLVAIYKKLNFQIDFKLDHFPLLTYPFLLHSSSIYYSFFTRSSFSSSSFSSFFSSFFPPPFPPPFFPLFLPFLPSPPPSHFLLLQIRPEIWRRLW